jgi:hypothetical protein
VNRTHGVFSAKTSAPKTPWNGCSLVMSPKPTRYSSWLSNTSIPKRNPRRNLRRGFLFALSRSWTGGRSGAGNGI